MFQTVMLLLAIAFAAYLSSKVLLATRKNRSKIVIQPKFRAITVNGEITLQSKFHRIVITYNGLFRRDDLPWESIAGNESVLHNNGIGTSWSLAGLILVIDENVWEVVRIKEEKA